MDILLFLIPVALLLGGIGLAAFLWCLKSKQYEDLEGAAHRILMDDDEQCDYIDLSQGYHSCFLLSYPYELNRKEE